MLTATAVHSLRGREGLCADTYAELKRWLDIGLFGLLVGGVVLSITRARRPGSSGEVRRASTWLGFVEAGQRLGLVVWHRSWDYVTEKPEITVFMGRGCVPVAAGAIWSRRRS